MRLPNGFGSVYKLSGKRRKPYVARKTVGWDDNGKQLYETIGYFEKRPEALQALAEFNVNPNIFKQEELTFKEIFTKWSKQSFPKLSSKSIEGYTSAFNNLRSLHNFIFVDIKLPLLQKTIDKFEDNWGKKYQARAFLNQLYDYAIKNDICEKKYSSFLDLGVKKKKLERIPFTKEEVQKIWDNIDTIRYSDTILILLYTGLRPTELLEIESCNVKLEERYMIGGKKTKAGIDRIIPIHEKIVPLIKKWLDGNNKYLIYSYWNKSLSYQNFKKGAWKDIMDTLKLNHYPHDTRHTFVTEMYNSGASDHCIKLIVGHSIPDITKGIYTHKTKQELIDNVNLLKY